MELWGVIQVMVFAVWYTTAHCKYVHIPGRDADVDRDIIYLYEDDARYLRDDIGFVSSLNRNIIFKRCT